jgi:hypothetical protein
MNIPELTDPTKFPDDAILQSHLGKAFAVWTSFTDMLSSEFDRTTLEWRYYRDGKAWLGKVTHKKKTICWIGVYKNYFRISFYFTARNDEEIAGLPVDKRYKDSYFSRPGIGKLKPMSIDVRSKKALESVFEIMRYKLS